MEPLLPRVIYIGPREARGELGEHAPLEQAHSSTGEHPLDARDVPDSTPAAPMAELEPPADTDNPQELLDTIEILEPEKRQDVPPQPVHGVRGHAPGPRGCWAITRAGHACGAPARGGEDFCNAHGGYGVAGNPAEFSPLAHAKRRENLAAQATLRAVLGITRSDSPRAALRVRAFAERERLATAALAGALDPDVAVATRAKHALDVIREVDPPLEVSVSEQMPQTVADVNAMGLDELRALLADYPSLPALEGTSAASQPKLPAAPAGD